MDYNSPVKQVSFRIILLLSAIACIYMGCGLKSKGEIIVQQWKDCHEKGYDYQDVVKLKNNSSQCVVMIVVMAGQPKQR
jgi:hypothetical protein